jgi:hypothetical protein
MDPLTLVIVKTIASSCLKFYLSSLMATGLSYKTSELGYKVPRWYMNPGRATTAFYAYGTSIEGDEFESIDDARSKAVSQMVKHIRLANQRMVQEKVSFDRSSVKQRRLVDLFIRGDGLEDFILMNARIDKKSLVKVKTPQEDMRAFVRLSLKTGLFIDHQEATMQALKSKIMHQKSDDILAEIDAEVRAYDSTPADPTAKPPSTPPPAFTPPPDVPPGIEFTPPPAMPSSPSSDGFSGLEAELDAESSDK